VENITRIQKREKPLPQKRENEGRKRKILGKDNGWKIKS